MIIDVIFNLFFGISDRKGLATMIWFEKKFSK